MKTEAIVQGGSPVLCCILPKARRGPRPAPPAPLSYIYTGVFVRAQIVKQSPEASFVPPLERSHSPKEKPGERLNRCSPGFSKPAILLRPVSCTS